MQHCYVNLLFHLCRMQRSSIWSEPQGVMMSTALACVHACVHACVPACVPRTCVRTYVRVGEACLGTSEVCNNWLRASRGLPGNEWSQCGWERLQSDVRVAENERIDGDLRLRAKNAWQRSGAAIIKKKRFVPEKFCPCTCSYEGEVCAWTAVEYGCGTWASAFILSWLRSRLHCTCMSMTTCNALRRWTEKHPNTRSDDLEC